MTLYFQDGGRDVRPPLAAASAGCPLASGTHAKALVCNNYALQFLIQNSFVPFIMSTLALLLLSRKKQ